MERDGNMDRLTYKTNGKYLNTISEQAPPYAVDCDIDMAIAKLAEYEDFEEIFRSKMTDITCEFLKDKKEFAKWLDRNKWIAKKCDEYARAEEQDKLPCAVGDTVYTNHSMKGWYFREKGRPYAAEVVFIGINSTGGFINVEIGAGHMTQFQISDLGKRFFLTRKEAEAALKEMGE